MRRVLTLMLAMGAAACAPRASVPSDPEAVDGGPFSIILYIVDGAGVAQWSVAKLAAARLAVDAFPVMGLVDVASATHRVTDSAASATAYATGVRTFNGAIGMGPDTVAVETVLELARARGMGTGLVVTSTVTHATPAAFAAHVPSRHMYWQIAEQMTAQRIDVLMGGGRRYFDPTERTDQLDLLRELSRRATYVATAEELAALDLAGTRSLVGLFWPNHPGTATRRMPSLPDMTDAALLVLEQRRRGFFLMVEAAQVDWLGHDNAPLRDVAAEMLDFDLAIGRGLEFQRRRPNTLLLVVSDHETGGLSLHGDAMDVFRAHYTTTGHTGELVPLFAAGPGAALFGGLTTNDAVGRLLLDLVRAGGPERIRPRARSGVDDAWIPLSH